MFDVAFEQTPPAGEARDIAAEKLEVMKASVT